MTTLQCKDVDIVQLAMQISLNHVADNSNHIYSLFFDHIYEVLVIDTAKLQHFSKRKRI